MTQFIQTFLDGLLLGGVYATIAAGLSLAFGVMRIINWAHGEFLMIAMYVASLIVTGLGIDPYVSILITGPLFFAVGFLLQKGPFNRLIERENAREPMSVMMFTIGLGMILTNSALLIFSANTRVTPTAYQGKTLALGDMIISIPRLISFGISILITLGLYYFLMKTETGRALRASSQNRSAATLMGINEKIIYCIAFGISIALVGVSASLLVPYFAVYPTVSLVFGFKAFVIVVLGGKGSIPGALLGGFIVGLTEKIGSYFFNDAYAQIVLFVLFVIILLVRPSGLLGKEKN